MKDPYHLWGGGALSSGTALLTNGQQGFGGIRIKIKKTQKIT